MRRVVPLERPVAVAVLWRAQASSLQARDVRLPQLPLKISTAVS